MENEEVEAAGISCALTTLVKTPPFLQPRVSHGYAEKAGLDSISDAVVAEDIVVV